MSESGLKKIGVIGIGTMGNGIAQVAAQSGFETVVMDVDAGVLEKGLDSISRSLDRLVKAFDKSGGEKGIDGDAKDEAVGQAEHHHPERRPPRLRPHHRGGAGETRAQGEDQP